MQPASRTIAGYRDAELVGQGGFGAVYRATDHDHGREVAIKVLPGMRDDTQRRRFDRERKAMGRLGGHANVISVHDSGYTEDGDGYIVMEYAPGGSYGDRLRREGPMPWRQAVDVVVAVAGAVEVAHRSGVLHRDIKPDNILVDRFATPKLTDFGIAAVAGSLTNTTSTTATLAHVAPEVMDGNPSSAASDVYSLASTFYNMVLGHPPFFRPTDEGTAPMIARILTEPPPDLTTVGVPAPVARAAIAALAKTPAKRTASPTELARQLLAAASVDGDATGQVSGMATTPLRADPDTAETSPDQATHPNDPARSSGFDHDVVVAGGPTRSASTALPPRPDGGPPSRPGGGGPGVGAEAGRRTVALVIGALALVAAGVMLAGAVGVVLFRQGDGPPNTFLPDTVVPDTVVTSAPVTSGSGAPGAAERSPLLAGDLTAGAEVVADATASVVPDGCGDLVGFEEGNLIDRDPTTAWRTPGDAVGERIIIRFDGSLAVAEVGLVPGWARIDPCDGTSRFEQNRRVERVRWTIGEVSVIQDLDPNRPEMQTIRLEQPVQSPDAVLEILASTPDGGRDYTAISDIRILGG